MQSRIWRSLDSQGNSTASSTSYPEIQARALINYCTQCQKCYYMVLLRVITVLYYEVLASSSLHNRILDDSSNRLFAGMKRANWAPANLSLFPDLFPSHVPTGGNSHLIYSSSDQCATNANKTTSTCCVVYMRQKTVSSGPTSVVLHVAAEGRPHMDSTRSFSQRTYLPYVTRSVAWGCMEGIVMTA
jgi:hypothetical protein